MNDNETKRERDEAQMDDAAMSLGELTDAAGVSVRTVRYYIAEGLLPPPEGAGPASAYGPGHLNRLRLIQRLKRAYLPLKEIRRQLAGLDDAEVRAVLAGDELAVAADPWLAPPDPSLADARDYLTLLESRAHYRTEPMALPLPAAPAPAGAAFTAEEPRLALRAATTAAGPAARPPAPQIAVPEQEQEPARPPEPTLWHRIPLGDDAELVISERTYGRHRDRVDWLVRWARKVFA